jgi:phage tail-like protein
MSIDEPARFSIITGASQWQRCAFGDASAGFLPAAVLDGVVQLGWDSETSSGDFQAVSDHAGAGLAFDGHCRLYHSVPGEGRVERFLWSSYDPARPQSLLPAADVLTAEVSPPTGEFRPAKSPEDAGFVPRALASNGGDHLYVLDSKFHVVRVVDVRQRRVVRSEPVPAGAADIAWHDGWLYVLSRTPAGLGRMTAARSLRKVDAPLSGLKKPDRLAVAADGRFFILNYAHASNARIFEIGRPGAWRTPRALALPGSSRPFAHASDIECVSGCRDVGLIVARRQNEDFLRVELSVQPYAWGQPLSARNYDGLGVAAAADGRVVYWSTKNAPRHATAARVSYKSPARVVGFRLDSGSYRTVWGRVLLEACLPANTAIRVHCIVSDEEDEGERVARTSPASSKLASIEEEAATPLPLRALMPAAQAEGQALFRREEGTEQPWLVEQDEFGTYETPAITTSGRYLWVVLDLLGNSRATPRLRTVRAERPGHDWLRRLPQLYSRQEPMRDFLQRYLAPLAGLEQELADHSESRHALLKPCSTPAGALPWLAGWLGLVLDERWSERAKRTFIREAAQLFRLRGTLRSLRRMVEIVAEAPVIIVEKFRMRGLARVGGDGWKDAGVLGAGLRVGGPVSAAKTASVDTVISDSFEAYAHRFSVIVLVDLSAERAAVIRHLLEVHRPAHTLCELCSAGSGMRVGRGLQVEMTSVIGPGSGFVPLQLGAAALGRESVLGRPIDAIRPGTTVLGRGSRIG